MNCKLWMRVGPKGLALLVAMFGLGLIWDERLRTRATPKQTLTHIPPRPAQNHLTVLTFETFGCFRIV